MPHPVVALAWGRLVDPPSGKPRAFGLPDLPGLGSPVTITRRVPDPITHVGEPSMAEHHSPIRASPLSWGGHMSTSTFRVCLRHLPEPGEPRVVAVAEEAVVRAGGEVSIPDRADVHVWLLGASPTEADLARLGAEADAAARSGRTRLVFQRSGQERGTRWEPIAGLDAVGFAAVDELGAALLRALLRLGEPRRPGYRGVFACASSRSHPSAGVSATAVVLPEHPGCGPSGAKAAWGIGSDPSTPRPAGASPCAPKRHTTGGASAPVLRPLPRGAATGVYPVPE